MLREGKNAVKWTRLSCHDFVDNQVRLQLFALAYKRSPNAVHRVWSLDLGNFLRRLALPRSAQHWSLIPIAIGIAIEVDQDRGEGGGTLSVRVLSDGGSGCAQAAVPGDPRTRPAAAPTRDGAAMTVIKVRIAGGRGGNGDGLFRSVMTIPERTISSAFVAQKRPDAPSIGRRMCLQGLGSKAKSLEKVGDGPLSKAIWEMSVG